MLMSKIIRIENLAKQSFNLMVDFTPNSIFGRAVGNNGNWRTLSQGVIAYNLGYLDIERSAGTLTTYHLLLFNKDANGWIIRLNDYGDVWGQNDAGDGFLVESCAIAVQGDYIRWEFVKIPG
jgi:hypothetical protein